MPALAHSDKSNHDKTKGEIEDGQNQNKEIESEEVVDEKTKDGEMEDPGTGDRKAGYAPHDLPKLVKELNLVPNPRTLEPLPPSFARDHSREEVDLASVEVAEKMLSNLRCCKRCQPIALRPHAAGTIRRWLSLSFSASEAQLDSSCTICIQFQRMLNALVPTATKDWLSLIYLVCLRVESWTFPRFETGIYLKIRAGSTSPDRCLFPTAPVTPEKSQVVFGCLQSDQANLELAKDWLHTCQHDHKQCRRSRQGDHLLRLIDCRTRTLQTAAPSQAYICLSYTWGTEPLETRTYDVTLPERLPATIEDAMHVAMELGLPYLWIDRYCINYSDANETRNVIRDMDQIYSRAEVTIIAAAGTGPHHGLPGVRGTPRAAQISLRIEPHTFVECSDVDAEIKSSAWNRRGWTYQETLLSRRRLVFTNSQMYFQCLQTHCLESLKADSAISGGSLEMFRVFPPEGIGRTIHDFNRRLEEYSKREISWKVDVIDAFTGIINAFDDQERLPCSITQFYGIAILTGGQTVAQSHDLAQSSFVRGLCWELTARNEDLLLSKPDFTFPTWSWASRKADVSWDPQSAIRYNMRYSQISKLDPTVRISVSHAVHGLLDLASFAFNMYNYKNCEPWLDISTWIFDLSAVREAAFKYQIDAWVEPEQDITCAYLGSNAVTPGLYGLLLQQTENGTLRRIGLWRITSATQPSGNDHDDGGSSFSYWCNASFADRWTWPGAGSSSRRFDEWIMWHSPDPGWRKALVRDMSGERQCHIPAERREIRII